jgi:membrane protein
MARGASTRKLAGGNRAQAVQEWLRRRADTPIGRLSLQWFRAYFAASRNSGCAITIYSSLSVLPMALIIVALVYGSGSDTNAFAQHLVDHLNLTGATAKLVEDTFGSASSNALAASVATAVSFLVWGIGIGQLYQDVYARAWGVPVSPQAADQGRYAIFFFVYSGALALSTIGQAELGDTGRRVLFTTLWVLFSSVFWVAVPRFLLHGQVAVRGLLPGALLAAVVLGGAAAFSPLFLPATMNANAKAFGSFGVVLTLIGWLFILITLSLVCAVFAPVWAEWRRTERDRPADQAVISP